MFGQTSLATVIRLQEPDQNSDNVGLVADLRDEILKRRTVEKKLRQANAKLRRANRVKTEFISMVSHELRTPLTAIKQGIDLVLEGIDGPVTEDQRETLGIGKSNVDRLARLVRNVLDVMRPETNGMTEPFKLTDLSQLLAETHRFMKPVAETKRINLVFETEGEAPPTLCAPDQIKQLVINLVDNAIKFTPQGGEVRLGLRCAEESAVIEVKDTGIGIKEGESGKIFEMFNRGSFAAVHDQGGSGVGLAVCHLIIHRHRGRILLHSDPGKGTAFSVSLPLSPSRGKSGGRDFVELH